MSRSLCARSVLKAFVEITPGVLGDGSSVGSVRFISHDEREAGIRLQASINGLASKVPEMSAVTLFTRRQRRGFVALIVAILLGLVILRTDTMIGGIAVITLFYTAAIIDRVVLFIRSQRAGTVDVVSDEEARAVPDDELPIYTVLVPAYREPEVIGLLLGKLGLIDYPIDRLDVKILLEADDRETIDAVGDFDLGDHVEVVLVPPANPRTKPKALNYGLSLAKGELLTIYDAEDHPESLQLRRAVVALRRHGPEVACVQAKLSYRNVDQNLITRWFTLEYAMWFSLLLPGLVSFRAPVPLGGTSNHFRRHALEEMGAWDPHNVTEDADLGIRFEREGFRVRILESTTLEEANSDFVNWVKQRSRWYKGYLQTWIIHMRHPIQLFRELGAMGFLQFNLFIGATPGLAILNPIFWALTIVWFVAHPTLIRAIFPAPVFYTGLLCWSLGNFAIAYMTVISCRMIKRVELLWSALLVPLYWVMMSIAATKALIQLVSAPTFWEKTAHGLDPTEHHGSTDVGEVSAVA
jgi:cellulose synthase/poly-beta-1,6-N-acetylglucosamine synthase-like glycosyltransferase